MIYGGCSPSPVATKTARGLTGGNLAQAEAGSHRINEVLRVLTGIEECDVIQSETNVRHG